MQNAHRALFTRVAIVPAAVDVLAGNHGLTAVESLAALDGLVGVDGLAAVDVPAAMEILAAEGHEGDGPSVNEFT